VKVYVKLSALLRKHHPGPNRSVPFEVALAEGALVSDLIPLLDLNPKFVRNAFINNEARDLDTPLQEGDQVALFPPVVGGSGAAARFFKSIAI
jgi:molybdopterin converting factor small subunit